MTEETLISGLQNQYLRFPLKHYENVRNFTMTKHSERAKNRDNIPFDRYVDIWWLAMCIGVQEGRRTTFEKSNWHQFGLAGELLPSNPWRIFQLKLLAVGITGNTEVLLKPGQLISIANEYAATGFPILIDVLLGSKVPIWAMTDFITARINRS